MHFTLVVSATKFPSSLRKTAAHCDLPSLSNPERPPNPPSYPTARPPAGIRRPNEKPLTLSSILPTEISRQDATESIKRWIAKLPDCHTIDMSQFSEKYGPAPSTPEDSPSRWTPKSRLRSWNLTPRKIVFILLVTFGIMFMNSFLSHFSNNGVRNTVLSNEGCVLTNMKPSVSPSSLPHTKYTVQCHHHPKRCFSTSRTAPSPLPRHNRYLFHLQVPQHL